MYAPLNILRLFKGSVDCVICIWNSIDLRFNYSDWNHLFNSVYIWSIFLIQCWATVLTSVCRNMWSRYWRVSFLCSSLKRRLKSTSICLITICANFLTTSCWCKRFLLLVLRFIIQNSSLSPVIIFAVWLNLLSYRRSTTVVIRQIICNIWSWDNSMMIQWNIWSCCSFLI